MEIKPTRILVSLFVIALIIFFVPAILNDKPKTHCTNKEDTAGGYYSVCTDPTFISVYTKYFSKNY